MSKHAGTPESTDYRVVQYDGKDLFVARKSDVRVPIQLWSAVEFDSLVERIAAQLILQKDKHAARFEILGRFEDSKTILLAPAYKLTRDVAGSPEVR